MRIKPYWKTVGIVANGTFPPAVAAPSKLAEMGMLDEQAALNTVFHHQSKDLAWFTAAGVTVKVLSGHLSVECSRPPYRRVRVAVVRLIRGLPDVRVGGLQFHRAIHFPVRRLSDWHRMADVLVTDFGWFGLGSDRIGTMQLEPGKPSGGSIAITACRSERRLDDGRTGIRIDVRDCYYGGDSATSTERVLEILAVEFAGAVADADSIVDGLMLLSASPVRQSMAA